MQLLKNRGFLDLFLKSECPLCQRSTVNQICRDCQNQIQSCQLAQKNAFWQPPLPLFAWGAYGGGLKRSIAALKYENQPQLARPLGQWLAQAWLDSPYSRQKATIVPIPMHAAKQKKRGYNQAELLARSFCELTGLPLRAQGLVRVRATEAQFGLSSEDRQQNLQDAIQLGSEFRQCLQTQPVVLLDDIYTTGATVAAAIAALKRHSIPVRGVITLAKSVRHQEKQSDDLMGDQPNQKQVWDQAR